MKVAQFMLFAGGITFIIAATVIFLLQSSDYAITMVGVLFLVVGFGDLVLALFIFRKLAEEYLQQSQDGK